MPYWSRDNKSNTRFHIIPILAWLLSASLNSPSESNSMSCVRVWRHIHRKISEPLINLISVYEPRGVINWTSAEREREWKKERDSVVWQSHLLSWALKSWRCERSCPWHRRLTWDSVFVLSAALSWMSFSIRQINALHWVEFTEPWSSW